MKTIAIFCFILFITDLFSQNDNERLIMQKTSDVINYDSIVYSNALRNSDYAVATSALYYLMAKNPHKIIAYKDSLTTIYYLSKSYQKCADEGNEVLSSQPENLRIMELVAISEKMLGNVKTSLGLYEKLYNKTGSLVCEYFIAEMQFNLQRYGECLTTTEKLITSENSKKEKIELALSADTKQTVFISAAAWNIKGTTYNELGKHKEAKEAFNNALMIDKDFTLPKTNLDKISEKK